MSLSLHGSPVLLVLALVAGAALGVWYYRRTVPFVARGPKVVLTILRAAAIATLIFALFEPLLHRVFSSVKDPRVIVLVDDSQSMGITDAREDRHAALGTVVDLLRAHPKRALFDGSLFADSVRFVSLDSLRGATTDGASTNIAAALQRAVKDRDERNVQAVLLLSDGVFTAGSDPRALASTLPVPVYTIGFGDSTEPRDIAVTAVIANSSVLLGNALPVDVRVHAVGFDGQTVGITLFDEGAVVRTQTVLLRPGTQEYAASFVATPATPGLHKFRVTITPLKGEQTERNNTRTFFVHVIDSKITVALFAGAPGPDVSFIAQALATNPHITVLPFIQSGDGSFLPTQGKGSLDDATCIVMVDFPTHATTQKTISSIIELLQQNNAPLLFVWGHDIDQSLASRFDPWMPFAFTPTRASEQLVGLAVPSDALADPVMRVRGGAADSAAWNALPPTTYVESGFKAKPGTSTLAVMRVLGTTSHQPMIVLQHLNRMHAVAVLTSGIWRWRLLGKGLSDATGTPVPDVYTSFFTNVVQWLTSAESDKLVRIQAAKPVFTPSEPVEFIGEVLDTKRAPVDDAAVTATVTGPTGTFSIALEPRGNGRYHGNLSAFPEGDYTLRGSAQLRGVELGTDNGKFSVADQGVEFQDIRMNAPLLRSLAAQSGGMFALSQDAPRLIDSLVANPRIAPATTVHATEVELWTNAWMLGAALLLFCAEWFLRKRLGLL